MNIKDSQIIKSLVKEHQQSKRKILSRQIFLKTVKWKIYITHLTLPQEFQRKSAAFQAEQQALLYLHQHLLLTLAVTIYSYSYYLHLQLLFTLTVTTYTYSYYYLQLLLTRTTYTYLQGGQGDSNSWRYSWMLSTPTK